MARRVNKTKFYSYKVGSLPKGCELCVQGKKLVLFVTGLCSKKCYYCPISDTKADKDNVYANEWRISKKVDVLEEAELCNAEGAGITGGDPLIRLDRVITYMDMLKNKFGKDFHIHLYTPLVQVTKQKLERLHLAGLDEIRFHPDLDNQKEWKKINHAKHFKWSIGVEIPAIPGKKKEIIKLVNFLKGKIDFLNINELEVSDTNANKLVEKGFSTKDKISYGIKGSEELGREILDYCRKNVKFDVHYCSSKLKDKVQLRNRIKRRAKNIAKKYDTITRDGTLLRGIIYLSTYSPGFSYRLMLSQANRRMVIKRLFKVKRELQRKFNIPFDMMDIDNSKLRLLISPAIVDDLKNDIKKMGLRPAIVEEYPTYDQLEVEVNFL